MNNRQLVRKIVADLTAKGVDVAIQPAVTTSSFYLTFDGGVLKRARVGDHKGRDYNYTFEIGKHIPFYQEVTKAYQGHEYTCYRFQDTEVADFIVQVLILRTNLRAKYGKEAYEVMRKKAFHGEAGN